VCRRRELYWKQEDETEAKYEVPFSVRCSISCALHLDLASSSRSTSRTTSEQRVRKRVPSNPRTRPKPTWVVFGYLCSFSSGSQPAMVAAYNQFHRSTNPEPASHGSSLQSVSPKYKSCHLTWDLALTLKILWKCCFWPTSVRYTIHSAFSTLNRYLHELGKRYRARVHKN